MKELFIVLDKSLVLRLFANSTSPVDITGFLIKRALEINLDYSQQI